MLRSVAQMDVTEFLEAVTDWAMQRHDICGLALVGSWGRGTATQKSDVDLVILCQQPARLLRDENWTRQFGDIVTSRKERYGVVTSMRVFYTSGIEAEFGIATDSWASIPLDSGTLRVISDGMQVLHDPDRLLKHALNAVAD